MQVQVVQLYKLQYQLIRSYNCKYKNKYHFIVIRTQLIIFKYSNIIFCILNRNYSYLLCVHGIVGDVVSSSIRSDF